jgi:hypothetical protein
MSDVLYPHGYRSSRVQDFRGIFGNTEHLNIQGLKFYDLRKTTGEKIGEIVIKNCKAMMKQ